MAGNNNRSMDVDEYLAEFPEDVRKVLENLRETIRSAAPDAEETFLHRLPTFRMNGHLVQFAVQTDHILFYPSVEGIEKFKSELSKFEGSSGAVIFPMDKPIPFKTIRKMVAYRLQDK
jgi:uncharacterized protein YdhG (YjbR/CyaY superfamily)